MPDIGPQSVPQFTRF